MACGLSRTNTKEFITDLANAKINSKEEREREDGGRLHKKEIILMSISGFSRSQIIFIGEAVDGRTREDKTISIR